MQCLSNCVPDELAEAEAAEFRPDAAEAAAEAAPLALLAAAAAAADARSVLRCSTSECSTSAEAKRSALQFGSIAREQGARRQDGTAVASPT